MRLATAAEMAELDRKTIEEVGIPGIVLMENAARGAALFFERVIPDLLKKRIVVLAGSGNNAGDGFVLARIFHGRGGSIRVVCLRPPEKLKGDALLNYQILERIGVPIFHWDEKEDFSAQFKQVQDSEVIIDALLGTGLKNEVRGIYRDIIDAVNALNRPVLAVDVPSGLDSGTGKILGTAVRAVATATFGLPKIGHVVGDGPALTGKLHVVDIGIPPSVVEESRIRRWWLHDDVCRGFLNPRAPDTHKGRAGHLCVVAGSPGKTGAAALVGDGALRVGAGLVTLAVPKSLNPILEVKLTEAMTLPAEETDQQTLAHGAGKTILDFLADKKALAVGPGVSLHEETARLVRLLIEQSPCAVAADADALTILASDPDPLHRCSAPVILTPHPGEMARLTGRSVPEIQARRVETAAEYSQEHGVIVVLKGYRTIIAAPDGRLAVNGSGTPAMASGGMGDVLTGMIGGFLAQGLEPFEAACLGVYIHGKAAEEAAGGATRGITATDLLEHIPRLIGALEENV